MTAASLKYGNSTGDPGDLALGNLQIPLGNGTTIEAIDLMDALSESWKRIDNGGTMANGEPVPSYTSEVDAGNPLTHSWIKMLATTDVVGYGSTIIPNWIIGTTVEIDLFTMPTGYRLSTKQYFPAVAMFDGSDFHSPAMLSIDIDGTVSFVILSSTPAVGSATENCLAIFQFTYQI